MHPILMGIGIKREVNRLHKKYHFDVINTQTLVAASSVEILSNPMVVEGNTVLSYTTVGTVSDGVDITISYLNINKETID